jgi:formate dehydrogenase
MYTDRHRLPAAVEKELNLQWFSSAKEMAPHCDVLTLVSSMIIGNK